MQPSKSASTAGSTLRTRAPAALLLWLLLSVAGCALGSDPGVGWSRGVSPAAWLAGGGPRLWLLKAVAAHEGISRLLGGVAVLSALP